MSSVAITFFGQPHIEVDGSSSRFATKKAIALLAYLAIANEWSSRDLIASLLWPASDNKRARASLRRTLSAIKQVLGKECIEANRREIRLHSSIIATVDICCFRNALESQNTDISILEEVAHLYQGRFMETFRVQDSLEYGSWQSIEADNLDQKAAMLFEQLTNYFTHAANYEKAFLYVNKWVAIYPLSEAAHRHLMVIYASQGKYDAALGQYQSFVQRLDDHLGIEPDPTTTRLYNAMLRHEKPASLTSSMASAVVHAPYLLSPFVGREADVMDIEKWLNEDHCRLLTIVGPGGIGKTRVAIEAVSACVSVGHKYFVSLVNTTSSEALIYAIADAVSFSFYGSKNPLTQLTDYLRQKKMLLILDNFEQLAADEESVLVIREMLKTTLYVKVVVTSRELLKLREEIVIELKEMTEPDAQMLFIQEATRTDATICLTEKDRPFIKTICQLVGYVPLGVKLATSWLLLLTCEEIANELSQDLRHLEHITGTIEKKHQSLKFAFETSWNLLTASERALLCKLAIFAKSGFSLQAAQQVTKVALLDLFAIHAKSLIYKTHSDRFQIYSVLYPFIEEKQLQFDDLEDIRGKHSKYYGSYTQELGPRLRSDNQQEAIHNLTLDFDNIMQAWQFALEVGDLDTMDVSLDTIYRYFEMRHRFTEATQYLQIAVSHPHLASSNLSIRYAIRYGWFCIHLRSWEEAKSSLVQALHDARQRSMISEIALAANHLGVLYTVQGELEAALVQLDESQAIHIELNHLWELGQIANNKAICLRRLGQFEQAHTCAQEAINIFTQLDDQLRIAQVYNTLATIFIAEHNLEAAHQHLIFSLDLKQQFSFGSEWSIACSLKNLGEIASERDQHLTAVQHYEKSLRLFENIGHSKHITEILICITQLYLILEQYDLVEHYLERLAKHLYILGEYSKSWMVLFTLIHHSKNLPENSLNELISKIEISIPQNILSRITVDVQPLLDDNKQKSIRTLLNDFAAV